VSASDPNDVFINCPFDPEFDEGFRALVFAVTACGFRPRCAREVDDATESRLEKIHRIIGQCRYGIHDISRTELDDKNGLPRFNMPLELGIFLGAKRFGDAAQKKKMALILDTEQYRFQKFISDLGGVDPTAHNGDPRRMVQCIRNWLFTVSRRLSIPGPMVVLENYIEFTNALPELANDGGFKLDEMAYSDLERIIMAWVSSAAEIGNPP
jgi:hypothetical protein